MRRPRWLPTLCRHIKVIACSDLAAAGDVSSGTACTCSPAQMAMEWASRPKPQMSCACRCVVSSWNARAEPHHPFCDPHALIQRWMYDSYCPGPYAVQIWFQNDLACSLTVGGIHFTIAFLPESYRCGYAACRSTMRDVEAALIRSRGDLGAVIRQLQPV